MNQTRIVAAAMEDPRTLVKRMIGFSILWLLLSSWTLLWSQNTSFHLIAGSFKTLKSANELVDVMTMKGHSPMIIFPNGKSTYYRVSVFNAEDRSVVSSYKKQIPNSSKFWTLAVNGASFRSSGTSTSSAPAPINRQGGLAETALYHVVIGSFPSRDAALRSQGARQAQGFKDAYILDPGAGSSKYRVAVYRSSNRREVETYRQQLLRSGKVKSSWIHEQQQGIAISSGNSSVGNRVVGGVYHLIGGSFKNFADADVYKGQMQGRGYNAMILLPKPGVSTTYRVSIERSAVRNDVKSVQSRYKAQTKKDSWIYFER